MQSETTYVNQTEPLKSEQGQPVSNNGEEFHSSQKEPHQIEFHPLAPYKGMVRRLALIYRHIIGLMAGGLLAHVKLLPPERKKGLHSPGKRILAFIVKPFVKKELKNLPFAVQLRRRLELMGSTYIKFGQIMAIREDILPHAITHELKNLLDRLPEIPFDQIKKTIEDEFQ